MRDKKDIRYTVLRLLLVALFVVAALPALRAEDTTATAAAKKAEEAKVAEAKAAAAQETTEAKPRLDISGFAMLDMGYEAGISDPNWFDTARPVKLPGSQAQADSWGASGHWFMGVRQSRLGFRGYVPTKLGEVKTIFEFELFGTGVDAGQTTFRLRHAWAELGKFGAGQYWSTFMDPDVFPNSLEYWGPSGIIWFRNVQFRWTPITGATTVAVALERPGASADQGIYQDRIELDGVTARFPLPDLAAHVRRTGDWGHVQLAFLLRQMRWDDTNDDKYDLTGKAWGWGFDLTTVINVKQDAIRAALIYGEGIQNYFNDAPVDVGIKNNFADPVTPVLGVPLPILGLSAFYDRNWNEKWTSTIGYSLVDITNSDAQAPSAFKKGQYALVNILYHPASNVLMGPELQWVRRDNFSDDWCYDEFRFQFSAKYSFNASIGGN